MFIAPAVAGNTTFVGSCSGEFYAFDIASGDVRWRYDTAGDGASAQFHGDALVTDELIVVGSDAPQQAFLYAFGRDSGAVRWKHPFPGGVAVDIQRMRGTALATSMKGDVFAVDLASGEILWWLPSDPLASTVVPTDPALADGRLFVPWRSGRLDAFEPATGELLWRRELPAAPNTSVAAFDNVLLLGTDDHELLRISPTDGEVLTTLEIDGLPYGELVVAEDCLVVLWSEPGTGAVAACVETDLSGVRWRYFSTSPGEWGTFEPLRVGDAILVGGLDLLVALRIADGTVAWSLPITGLPRGLGSSEEFLLVGTLAGRVFAFPWLDR